MTGWHYISRIEPQKVRWSEPMRADDWSPSKDSGHVKLAAGPKRGTRAQDGVVSGHDAFGRPSASPGTVYIHWRKWKRMRQKMYGSQGL